MNDRFSQLATNKINRTPSDGGSGTRRTPSDGGSGTRRTPSDGGSGTRRTSGDRWMLAS